MPEKKAERKGFVGTIFNSLSATPARQRFLGCPPPTAVVPGGLAAAVPAPGRRATTQIAPSTGACTSTRSAGAPVSAMRLVRITHPFHPLSGREVACVGERYNRYGRRLLLRVDDVTVCSVPPQWTDLVAPDPEIVIGAYRTLFRVADLLALGRLVDQLRKRDSSKDAR